MQIIEAARAHSTDGPTPTGEGMMSDLYDEDFVAWSEREAAIMRDVAEGRRPNEALDWPNIIEEVEGLARSETRACKSYLLQALLHDLKARAWPGSREVRHWQEEADARRYDAREAFAPSMRQRIDLAAIYRQARRRLPPDIDGQPPLPLPDVCPVSLDELLSEP